MHGLYARYAAPGQLLVVTGDGKLLAVPFDPDKLAFTGPPVAMLEGMRTGGFESNLATSAEGTMVYVSGGSAGLERAFWVGRDGAATPGGLGLGSPGHPQLAFRCPPTARRSRSGWSAARPKTSGSSSSPRARSPG